MAEASNKVDSRVITRLIDPPYQKRCQIPSGVVERVGYL